MKVTGGLNIEWGQIDPKATGGLKGSTTGKRGKHTLKYKETQRGDLICCFRSDDVGKSFRDDAWWLLTHTKGSVYWECVTAAPWTTWITPHDVMTCWSETITQWTGLCLREIWYLLYGGWREERERKEEEKVWEEVVRRWRSVALQVPSHYVALSRLAPLFF